MSWKNSFSLNTTPAPSDQEGGGAGGGGGGGSPIDTAIDESFWKSHLWPHHQSPPPPPPPVNIFDRAAEDSGFAFPLLAGVGWGVKGKEKVVAAAKEDKQEEEEIIKRIDDGGDQVDKGKGKKRMELEWDAASNVNGERERRKKMRSMFNTLQSLLPHLSDKVDKASIVEQAISYIKTLETSLHSLQHQMADKPHRPKTAIVTYEPLTSTTPQLMLAGQTTRESFLADYGSVPSSFPLATVQYHPGPNHHDQHGRVMFQTWTSNVVLNTFGENEAMIMAFSRKKPGLLAAIAAVLEKHQVEVKAANVCCDGQYCSFMILTHLTDGETDQQCPNSSSEGVYKEAFKELMLLVVDKAVKDEPAA